MDDIPPQLIVGLTLPATEAARAWWARLAEEDRVALAALCGPGGVGPEAPRIIGGQFIPADDAAGWSEWLAAYLEDLVAQPDPVFYEPPFVRTYYIG